MANTINYAAKYERELIETYIDGSYAAPFVATNVNWLDAKNFHFTVLTTGGYKNHALTGGWNRQNIPYPRPFSAFPLRQRDSET